MTDVPHAVVASKLGSTPGCGVSARPLPEWALDLAGHHVYFRAGSPGRTPRGSTTENGVGTTVRASSRLQFTSTSVLPVKCQGFSRFSQSARASGSWNRTACSPRAARHGRMSGHTLCYPAGGSPGLTARASSAKGGLAHDHHQFPMSTPRLRPIAR